VFDFHVIFELFSGLQHIHNPIILVAQSAEDVKELDAAPVVRLHLMLDEIFPEPHSRELTVLALDPGEAEQAVPVSGVLDVFILHHILPEVLQPQVVQNLLPPGVVVAVGRHAQLALEGEVLVLGLDVFLLRVAGLDHLLSAENTGTRDQPRG